MGAGAALGANGFSSGHTLQSLQVPVHLHSVWVTQLGPGEGKCSSTAIPFNVLSKTLARYCVLCVIIIMYTSMCNVRMLFN